MNIDDSVTLDFDSIVFWAKFTERNKFVSCAEFLKSLKKKGDDTFIIEWTRDDEIVVTWSGGKRIFVDHVDC